MLTRRGIHGRARVAAVPLRAVAVLLLALALVAGCDPATPTSGPSASSASRPSTVATASPKPGATSSASATKSPSASPSPTAPVIVGAVQAACPGHATTPHRGSVIGGQSRNWAGYIVGATKGRVTCVEGTWSQPRVRCPASGQTSVAIWVGIDGSSAIGSLPDASATLAQTGTSGQCVNGEAQYNAWYEFLPDLRHMAQLHVPVSAGDKIWAQVRWFGKGKFVATVINLTKLVGDSQAWTLRLAPLLTAEWIVEEPALNCSSGTCQFVTLARFGTVRLNGAVTVSGSRYKIYAIPFPYLRTSINRSGKNLAVPSSLSSRGFTVTWKSS